MNPHGTCGRAAADLHQQRCRHWRIFFIFLVVGFDNEFIAGETLRPVALLAGFPCRAQILHGGRDRPRVGVEGNRDNLPQARKLGADKPAGSRADVTSDAFHACVGRILVRGIFGCHHGVASLPTEAGAIHVGHAAIRGERENKNVDHGGPADERNPVPHRRSFQVDLRIIAWEFASVLQLSAAQKYSDWNQEQSKDEDARQDEEDQQADVRVRRTGQREVVNPEGDQRDGATGGESHANEANRVLAEEVNQAGPVSDCNLWTHTGSTPRFLRTDLILFLEEPWGRIHQSL